MSNELAVIEEITANKAPVIYGHGKLDYYYEHVKAEVENEVPDLSTKKGRDRIASLAAKVSRSKTAVEKPGREYLKSIKELPKTIEAELREFTRQMDELRDETRKPLTDWENTEKARIASHEQAILRIEQLSQSHHEEGIYSSALLRERLIELESITLGDHWEEFEAQAARTKESSLNRLKVAIMEQEKAEAEAIEAERLRAEAEEKARIEREEQIRKEASEAERVAAEQRAEAERQRVEQEKLQAQQEAERKEREHQAAIDRAYREKAEAEAQAAHEKLQAEERQRQAVEAERQRIEVERVAAEQEAARVASNRAHRANVNRETLASLISFGMNEEGAKVLVRAIAKGEIANIAIKY
jgi:hypothetical protein